MTRYLRLQTTLVLFTPLTPVTAPLQLGSASGGSAEASTAGSSETLTTASTLEVSSGLFFAPLSLNDAADFEEEIEEVVIAEVDFDEEIEEGAIEETNFQEEINETDFEEELDDLFHSVDWLDWLNDGSLN